MKRLTKLSLLAAAIVAVSAGSASAESLLVARIPFPFVVGSKAFEPGRYVVRTDARGVLLIQGLNARGASYAFTKVAPGADPAGSKPVLVFAPYETTHRLTQVWDSRSEGYILPTPLPDGRLTWGRAESEAAKAPAYVRALAE